MTSLALFSTQVKYFFLKILLVASLYGLAIFFLILSFLRIHGGNGHLELYTLFLFLSFYHLKNTHVVLLVLVSILEDSFRGQIFGLSPLLYLIAYLSWTNLSKLFGNLTFSKIWILFGVMLLFLKYPISLYYIYHNTYPQNFTLINALSPLLSLSLTFLLIPFMMHILTPFFFYFREVFSDD